MKTIRLIACVLYCLTYMVLAIPVTLEWTPSPPDEKVTLYSIRQVFDDGTSIGLIESKTNRATVDLPAGEHMLIVVAKNDSPFNFGWGYQKDWSDPVFVTVPPAIPPPVVQPPSKVKGLRVVIEVETSSTMNPADRERLVNIEIPLDSTKDLKKFVFSKAEILPEKP